MCEEGATGMWSPIADAPQARWSASAVWAEDEVIVWGGLNDVIYEYRTEPLRYDLVADAWTVGSDVGAPRGRSGHSSVWTGNEMLVWGGAISSDPSPTFEFLSEGARYDPVADGWATMSEADAPTPRIFHTGVWTGSRFVVWGGANYNLDTQFKSGGVYDPVADNWSPMDEVDAPSGRFDHAYAWTGAEVFVWGGYGLVGPQMWGSLGDGGLYDPVTDSWRPITAEGAPEPMQRIVAGASDGVVLVYSESTVARYDSANDAWLDSFTNCDPRDGPAVVWTGDAMLSWGGVIWQERPCWELCSSYFRPEVVRVGVDGTMHRDDAEAPSWRGYFMTAWTDGGLWLWGGSDSKVTLSSGWIYMPAP